MDQMQETLERNLLKYAAGRAMFCQCGAIADWRKWVIVERPDGTLAGNCCASCHDAAIGDKPLPDGYRVIRHGKPVKTAKKPGHCDIPQKPGRALNTYLRKDILAYRKRDGYLTKTDREFPKQFGVSPWPMVETTFVDTGEVRIDYAGDPHYSALQIADYVRQFCRLNHLTGD